MRVPDVWKLYREKVSDLNENDRKILQANATFSPRTRRKLGISNLGGLSEDGREFLQQYLDDVSTVASRPKDIKEYGEQVDLRGRIGSHRSFPMFGHDKIKEKIPTTGWIPSKWMLEEGQRIQNIFNQAAKNREQKLGLEQGRIRPKSFENMPLEYKSKVFNKPYDYFQAEHEDPKDINDFLLLDENHLKYHIPFTTNPIYNRLSNAFHKLGRSYDIENDKNKSTAILNKRYELYDKILSMRRGIIDNVLSGNT